MVELEDLYREVVDRLRGLPRVDVVAAEHDADEGQASITVRRGERVGALLFDREIGGWAFFREGTFAMGGEVELDGGVRIGPVDRPRDGGVEVPEASAARAADVLAEYVMLLLEA